NRAGHASQAMLGQPTCAAATAAAPTKNRPHQIDSGISQATPAGHGFSTTYGPPDAHEPPMAITDRIPKNSRVRHATDPAVAPKRTTNQRPRPGSRSVSTYLR